VLPVLFTRPDAQGDAEHHRRAFFLVHERLERQVCAGSPGIIAGHRTPQDAAVDGACRDIRDHVGGWVFEAAVDHQRIRLGARHEIVHDEDRGWRSAGDDAEMLAD
jgi:hypothetical protein